MSNIGEDLSANQLCSGVNSLDLNKKKCGENSLSGSLQNNVRRADFVEDFTQYMRNFTDVQDKRSREKLVKHFLAESMLLEYNEDFKKPTSEELAALHVFIENYSSGSSTETSGDAGDQKEPPIVQTVLSKKYHHGLSVNAEKYCGVGSENKGRGDKAKSCSSSKSSGVSKKKDKDAVCPTLSHLAETSLRQNNYKPSKESYKLAYDCGDDFSFSQSDQSFVQISPVRELENKSSSRTKPISSSKVSENASHYTSVQKSLPKTKTTENLSQNTSKQKSLSKSENKTAEKTKLHHKYTSTSYIHELEEISKKHRSHVKVCTQASQTSPKLYKKSSTKANKEATMNNKLTGTQNLDHESKPANQVKSKDLFIPPLAIPQDLPLRGQSRDKSKIKMKEKPLTSSAYFPTPQPVKTSDEKKLKTDNTSSPASPVQQDPPHLVQTQDTSKKTAIYKASASSPTPQPIQTGNTRKVDPSSTPSTIQQNLQQDPPHLVQTQDTSKITAINKESALSPTPQPIQTGDTRKVDPSSTPSTVQQNLPREAQTLDTSKKTTMNKASASSPTPQLAESGVTKKIKNKKPSFLLERLRRHQRILRKKNKVEMEKQDKGKRPSNSSPKTRSIKSELERLDQLEFQLLEWYIQYEEINKSLLRRLQQHKSNITRERAARDHKIHKLKSSSGKTSRRQRSSRDVEQVPGEMSSHHRSSKKSIKKAAGEISKHHEKLSGANEKLPGKSSHHHNSSKDVEQLPVESSNHNQVSSTNIEQLPGNISSRQKLSKNTALVPGETSNQSSSRNIKKIPAQSSGQHEATSRHIEKLPDKTSRCQSSSKDVEQTPIQNSSHHQSISRNIEQTPGQISKHPENLPGESSHHPSSSKKVEQLPGESTSHQQSSSSIIKQVPGESCRHHRSLSQNIKQVTGVSTSQNKSSTTTNNEQVPGQNTSHNQSLPRNIGHQSSSQTGEQVPGQSSSRNLSSSAQVPGQSSKHHQSSDQTGEQVPGQSSKHHQSSFKTGEQVPGQSSSLNLSLSAQVPGQSSKHHQSSSQTGEQVPGQSSSRNLSLSAQVPGQSSKHHQSSSQTGEQVPGQSSSRNLSLSTQVPGQSSKHHQSSSQTGEQVPGQSSSRNLSSSEQAPGQSSDLQNAYNTIEQVPDQSPRLNQSSVLDISQWLQKFSNKPQSTPNEIESSPRKLLSSKLPSTPKNTGKSRQSSSSKFLDTPKNTKYLPGKISSSKHQQSLSQTTEQRAESSSTLDQFLADNKIRVNLNYEPHTRADTT